LTEEDLSVPSIVKKNGENMKTNWVMIGAILLVGAFVFMPSIFSGLPRFTAQAEQGSTGAIIQGTTAVQEQNVQCLSSTSPTTTPNTNNLYTPGSDDTKGIYNYRKAGGAFWTSAADDAATGTVEPFTLYEFAIGVDGTTENGGSITYGPVLLHKNGCLTAESLELLTQPAATVAQVTPSYFDAFDRPSTEIDDSAGGTNSLKIRFKGTYQTDFGNRFCENGKYNMQGALGPVETDAESNRAIAVGYANILVVDYNKTLYASDGIPKVSRTSHADFVVREVAVPSLHTANGTANAQKAYALPAIRSDENLDVFYNYKISSNAVLEDDLTNSGNLTFSLYPVGLYLDNNAGQYKCGAEDENGARVGGAGTTPVRLFPDSDAW